MLLACGIALVTAIFIGGLSHNRLVKVTTNTAIEGLAGETRLVALEFKGAYTRMHNDAQVVMYTPPIQGLIRSMRHGNVDPMDGSTTMLWRHRLETIFISVMERRTSYTQMRYIGIADSARELVRVNRTADGFERVSTHQLQQKVGEPYLAHSLNLSKDDYYFSEVTYNREHGTIEPKRIPTVRLVLPVFDDASVLYGWLVINADYSQLLSETFMSVAPKKETFIVNEHGDYMTYTPESKSFDLKMHDHYALPPDFVNAINVEHKDEKTYQAEDKIAYFVRLKIDQHNPKSYLGVVLQVDRDTLLAGAYEARIDSLKFALLLLFITLVGAALAATIFTKPLQEMTRAVRAARQNEHVALQLPVNRKDEIGDLAVAFLDLAGKLIDSESRAREVLENVNDGILTLNAKGQIDRFNPASEKMFGYAAEEVCGQHIGLLMPSPYYDQYTDYLMGYKGADEDDIVGTPREVLGRRRDGSIFPMELSLSKVMLNGNPLFTGIIRDITERKSIEAEREHLIQKLMQSNRELDNFAYIASHDLKEPLRAIYNHSCFLKEDYAELIQDDGKRRLDRLTSLTKRMEKLINDLLYFSRLGREEMAFRKTDLNEVINDISSMLEDVLQEKNAEINIAGKLPTVKCNAVRVTELFRNLITNAIKYNEQNHKRITVGVSGEDQHVFYVKDNGIGIEPAFHKDIFRIFKRLHSEKEYEGGTGVGLTFVKKIVERHGGKIWLESVSGEGTTFYFTLSPQKVQQESVPNKITI